MASLFTSIDNLLKSSGLYGLMHRGIATKSPGTTTAANTTSGYTTMQRLRDQFTLPALGSGMSGAYLVACDVLYGSSGGGNPMNTAVMCALEVSLGTLTVSGNSFADGSAMPSRTIEGSSVQLASLFPVVVVTSTLTATTPVLTITYTDQLGNTGNTATLTLPTSPALGSVFRIAPHLASGDTGIRDVTNLSISTGTAGELKVFGLMPLAVTIFGGTPTGVSLAPLTGPFPMVPLSASDVLGFYSIGNTGNYDLHAALCFVGDTT